MNSRHTHEVARVAVLERMEASRHALLLANRALALPGPRSPVRTSAVNVISSLAEVPHVTTVLAVMLGVLVLGPRRALSIASRSGLSAWIARSVRRSVPG
ncbi:hypothetical protein LJ656_06240 [Paraburkholderia sp. MMS20-SJTR3]|uniref:Uncharacterized protein n=1 Tax=Paraburkholderia sejongensis TaxID=2886946 RepID=A0ABS8JQJ5_9BURK|nr:hypothetical protein [Paraburkholderia sp. MMS20-SJTR3]MCC8392183.1 hypothetical protein [Paraburkholderia sp. MMS20-SJTR3]